jgi:hypothetical protein
MRASDRFSLRDLRCELGGSSMPVANLSVGGFFVACDPPLPTGHAVSFELAFPAGPRIPAVGRVAWVNSPEAVRNAGLPTGCGITITRIAFPDKLAIIDLLRRSNVVPPSATTS